MNRRSLVVVVIAACSSDSVDRTSEQRRDPQRRAIEPPARTLHKRPPYVIISSEVGPYQLRQSMTAVLEKLPGPRIARFEIPGLLHTSLIRDEDGVLIGGEPGTSPASVVMFVAIVGGDVARTESGVHVGQSTKKLDKLGPLVADPDRARDPRLLVPAGLRNGRIVVVEDRVAAIAIVSEPTAARDPGADAGCARPPANESGLGACLTAAGERVATDGDDVVVRSADGGKSIASVRVSGLVFAAPLRNPVDGRDEVVAISRTEDPQQRTWWVTAFAIEGGKRTTVIEQTQLYQLQAAQSRWIGADLHEVDLYLELTSRSDGIDFGGLLTTREHHNKIRDVLMISPVAVMRRHGKPASEPDAGAFPSDGEPRNARSGADSAKP